MTANLGTVNSTTSIALATDIPASASQAEMEAGTEAGLRQVSPLRVAQAIAALASGGSGSVATDTIWDAAGDLAVGTGSDTAARLAKGNDGAVLAMGNGTVTWNAGTSFPGSKATNDRYWRTDLSMEFYWDGTRWLSTQLFRQPFGLQDGFTPTSAATQTGWAVLGDGTSDLWVSRVLLWTYVATTNNGTSYWTIGVTRNPSGTSLTGSVLTNGDTANTSTRHNVTVGALTGTTDQYFALFAVKNVTPGALYVEAIVEYRIVGT